MTKVTVVLKSLKIPEDSFAAKPKVMYRAGDGYCRTEEMPDIERGLHSLAIISEPNAWMVNLLTKTAHHFVDPGPTFNCHLVMFTGGPVKSSGDITNPLLELEFGRELAYFKGRRAVPMKGPIVRDKLTSSYTVTVSDSQLSLFTTGTPERPWAVARQIGEFREVFWYLAYEDLPFDAKLFVKPNNVKIEDVNQ